MDKRSKSMKDRHARGELSGINSPNWKGGKVTIHCYICGKASKKWKSQLNKSGIHVCDGDCKKAFHKMKAKENKLGCVKGNKHYKWRKDRVDLVCPICLTIFRPKNDKQQCCSEDCKKIFYTGENASNWKGGIDTLYKRVRGLSAYKTWRKTILKRDNYICQECKGVGEIAHHIERFMKLLHKNEIKTTQDALLCEELWDIDNGITLCEECHKMEHKRR